jgi:hypothetical protein
MIVGPSTGRWGDVQKQIGLEHATRPFVYFLDDDNVMLPTLAELVIPALEATPHAGVVFGICGHTGQRFYVWPPPAGVIERSQVDTAMFLGRSDAARRIGWPDLDGGRWPDFEGERCADFLFIRAVDETFGLRHLPAIYGFRDGATMIREFEPDLYATLERGHAAPERLLGILLRHLRQADAPPWLSGRTVEGVLPTPR